MPRTDERQKPVDGRTNVDGRSAPISRHTQIKKSLCDQIQKRPGIQDQRELLMRVRVIAIDWSGDRKNAHKKIWLGEVVAGQLRRLESGWNQEGIAGHLLNLAEQNLKMVIGLDFAFSFPAWFFTEHNLETVHALWGLVGREGEKWLAECQPPFWGREGHPRLLSPDRRFRRTESTTPTTTGIRPKSVFQIAGAGAVGTGSLRGMSLLHRLHQAGFSVWPFDPPGWPRVIEIYPRLLTGVVNKSDRTDRTRYLREQYPSIDEPLHETAASCEDAFDAAVSALIMDKDLDELLALTPTTDPQTKLEGHIWCPQTQ